MYGLEAYLDLPFQPRPTKAHPYGLGLYEFESGSERQLPFSHSLKRPNCDPFRLIADGYHPLLSFFMFRLLRRLGSSSKTERQYSSSLKVREQAKAPPNQVILLKLVKKELRIQTLSRKPSLAASFLPKCCQSLCFGIRSQRKQMQ